MRSAAPSASELRARVVVRRREMTVTVAVTLDAGEHLAVMGPSGAGKSTFAAALAAEVKLTEGFVRAGDDAGRTGRVVLLGQRPLLFPHLTAAQNIAFGPRAAGMRSQSALDLAHEWMERVGLAGYGARWTSELSGGEQQRVAIARALAASPGVVVLDEPLVALDPVTADELRGLLAEQLRGFTSIVVTHDVHDALALCERLMIIEAGQVVQEGEMSRVLNTPRTDFGAHLAQRNRVVGVVRGGHFYGGGIVAQTSPEDALPLPLPQQAAAPAGVGRVSELQFRWSEVRVARSADGHHTGGRAFSFPARVVARRPFLHGVRLELEVTQAAPENAAGQRIFAELPSGEPSSDERAAGDHADAFSVGDLVFVVVAQYTVVS